MSAIHPDLPRLLENLPELESWVSDLIEANLPFRRKVSELGFSRLVSCFPSTFLEESFAIPCYKTPFPPLSKMGIAGFSEMENLDGAGVAYPNHFFIQEDSWSQESLFLHELVHLVQWSVLGPKRFIVGYALGHLLRGYDKNPFEETAYQVQRFFETSETLPAAYATAEKDIARIESILFPHMGGKWPI